MKIFWDTAQLDEIQAAASWGILDGVTTNPSLAAKAGRAFKENILAISEIIGERATVSAETVSLEIVDDDRTISYRKKLECLERT